MWNDQSLQEDFDIIIEDGLHTFSANVCFFEKVYVVRPVPELSYIDVSTNSGDLSIDPIKSGSSLETEGSFGSSFLTKQELNQINTQNKTIFVQFGLILTP